MEEDYVSFFIACSAKKYRNMEEKEPNFLNGI